MERRRRESQQQAHADEPLTGEVEQGLCRRGFSGTPMIQVSVIPPAAEGTEGALAVRTAATGAAAICRWWWQPRERAGMPAPATRAGFLSRLVGRAKTTPAVARMRSSAARAATVANVSGGQFRHIPSAASGEA
jgi:hypothetical protein